MVYTPPIKMFFKFAVNGVPYPLEKISIGEETFTGTKQIFEIHSHASTFRNGKHVKYCFIALVFAFQTHICQS